MASQVILKKSSVAARVPVAGDLAYGELALNYADGLLYFKKSDGTTIGIIGNATGTNTGDETTATIKTKLGITTLSGSNTGDQVLPTLSTLGGQPLDADLTAIAALAGTSGLLKKTAADTWSLDTTAYTTNLGTVTGVTATAPVVSSGGTTPVISMAAATTSASGYLTSTDWNTFNGKQAAGTYATGTGSASGTNTGDETTATIKTKLGITTLSGSNTGDETTATIKTKLGITTLSGSNTGDQTIPTTLPNANAITFTSSGGAAAGSTYTGAAVLTVDYATVGAAAAGHTHSYQAADADLLAIGGLTGTTGLLKKTAADTWTLDTTAYLTSYTESDTLATVTARGASTSTAVTLSNAANRYSGHFYYDPYDAAGNHYPHFTDGSSASGTKINWRLFTGATNSVVHTWTTSLATFGTNIAATNFSGSSSGTNTGDNPGVTSVAGVTPIVSSGGTTPSISHATSGATAGTYNNVTVNTFGHVTAGSNVGYVTSSGVTSVATSGGYGGLTLTGGTITTTGTITMGGTPTGTWPISVSGSSTSTPLVSIDNSIAYGRSGLQFIQISSAAGDVATTTNAPTADWWHIIRANHGNASGYYTDLALPMTSAGNIRYRRIAAGASSGWITVWDSTNLTNLNQLTNGPGYGTGTVTAVTATTPIISSGGTTPNITHATSGATAGTYNNVTVNTFGHVTAGSNVAYYHSGNVPPYPAEADTLATVTGRGASTTTAVILNGGLSTGTASTGVTRAVVDNGGNFLSYYSSETTARIQLGRDVGVSGGAGLALGGALYALIASSDTNGSALYFKLNAAAATAATSPNMALTATGLGIGITAPGAKLEVTAASAAVAQRWSYAADTTNYSLKLGLRDNGASDVSWEFTHQTNSATYNVLTFKAGKVGIGTASPLAPLHVFYAPAANTTVDDVVRITSKYNAATGASAVAGSGPAIVFSGGIGDNQTRDRARIVAVYEASNMSGLSFHTQSTADIVTERMRLTINGGVSFGSTGTAYGTSGQVLQSNGNASPTWVAHVTSIAATTPIVTSAATGAITLSHAASGVTAGTYNNVTVNATGHVTAGSNTAYLTALSDTLQSVMSRGATTSTTYVSTTTTPFAFQSNSNGGTYNQTQIYVNQNNTSGSASNGIVIERGRLTDSGSAEIRSFTIAARGGQVQWQVDGNGNTTQTGSLSAISKSFLIDHPTKPGMQLRYGSLEGPENGVYVRGKLRGNKIELPEYWTKLVDPDSITVNLTAIGKSQNLYIEDIKDNVVYVGGENVNCFYTVFAERVDVAKLEVEIA